MTRVEFIYQHREEWPISLMCRLLEVSRSYYYQCIKRLTQDIPDRDGPLKEALQRVFEQHRANYGSRRLTKALNEMGFKVGRYKVRRLMKELGLYARYPKRYRATTDSNHRYPIAGNVLDRNFTVEAPNQVWTADVSYVWTEEGWMYLAIVVDLFSRQIIGWSFQEHMRTSLCRDALEMAWWRRKQPTGVLHHSDRGSQ